MNDIAAAILITFILIFIIILYSEFVATGVQLTIYSNPQYGSNSKHNKVGNFGTQLSGTIIGGLGIACALIFTGLYFSNVRKNKLGYNSLSEIELTNINTSNTPNTPNTSNTPNIELTTEESPLLQYY